MQLIKNGPDIPERLLQAHEEGRVVFFCGAGISYPAGLPSFRGLVEKLYDNLSVDPDAEQEAAIRAKRFDTVIGLLENKIVGGRKRVRMELADILTPNLNATHATTTHEALLTLSRNREQQQTRLVTTNFDRLFEKAICKLKLDCEHFQAPTPPIPKNRWDGLVYLHGLLPKPPSTQELDHLVVSDSDFGRAYLNDGWAARFVAELFRSHTICFIGYSIDDPVLRYITAAAATDRLSSESPLEMFTFGSYSKGKKKEQDDQWEAKNVKPILYREYRRHWYLHKTLSEWAAIHRDGVPGKERIVARYAGLHPKKSTEENNFVGRLLWAVSDPSGLPARRFPDHDPAPSLDWLEVFEKERYQKSDLIRFGVVPDAGKGNEPMPTLIRRPYPYSHASWMTLLDESAYSGGWDSVMRHIARWLLRHLDDPKLLLWLTSRGSRLHREFAGLIERRLKELDELERNDKDELRRIRENAPHAVPRPAMCTLWRVMLAGRVKSSSTYSDTYDVDQWRHRFGREGLTGTLRLELRDLLAPRISLRAPLLWGGDGESISQPEHIRQLVDWEVVLSSNHAHSWLVELQNNPLWPEELPGLLDDFSALLRDAIDLMRELGGANDKVDFSYLHQPSIEMHHQNNDFHNWTALIDLTREAWLATARVAPERARLVAETWHLTKYPVFQRLSFFAATHENIVPPRQALDWLLGDDRWWLWSAGIQREAIRLSVTLALSLDAELLTELEQAILAGPPRAMYKDDLEDEAWMRIVEREIWLRLAKMAATDAAMGTEARAKLDELTSRHPTWQLQEGDRDEFPFWTEDGIGSIHYPERGTFTETPRRRDLVAWLKQHPENDVWLRDDGWPQLCRGDFPTAAYALSTLAQDGIWLEARWQEALHAWSEEKLIERSWRHMASVPIGAPDDTLQSIARDVGRWLGDVAKAFASDKMPRPELFLDLCRRILAFEYRDGEDEDDHNPLTRAINHPVGEVTQALLYWWFRSPLEDGQGLPDELKPIFTELCDARIGKFRHSRVLLAARVIVLFRVDREWAEQHLLPLFSWQNSEVEAAAVWRGFLHAPRLYRPLIESIKQPFLDTAHHYEKLDPHGDRYATLLAIAALDHGDTFTAKELRAATEALSERGLCQVAYTLQCALNESGDRRVEYWSNRVQPYLRQIWPQSHDRKTQAVSEHLAGVCIAAGDAFPKALAELRHWLRSPIHPGYLMCQLKGSSFCGKFPEEALTFLHLIAGDGYVWEDSLKECLEQIQEAKSDLKYDRHFQQLLERLRRSGQELE